MSHAATNWAIQQRGLSPVTKLVLWHLCDRHNPDYGCFPSQDQLAADVEISRASLNVHLEKLESAGLIHRQRRHSEDTHRRKSTRYLLAFEAEFGRDPWSLGANASLTFTVHAAYLPRPRIPINGPQGVQATFEWQAARATSPARMCTAVLVNTTTSY